MNDNNLASCVWLQRFWKYRYRFDIRSRPAADPVVALASSAAGVKRTSPRDWKNLGYAETGRVCLSPFSVPIAIRAGDAPAP